MKHWSLLFFLLAAFVSAASGSNHLRDKATTQKHEEESVHGRGLFFGSCGKQGKDLILTDTARKFVRLYDQKEEFLILIFWSPTCGHCKKEMPKIKTWYDRVKKEENRNFEVVAIVTTQEEEPWKKYVNDNGFDWVNVMDYYGRSNFRYWYNIYSTPVVYLLDKDRKIIAKRVDVETLEDIMKRSWDAVEDEKRP